MPGSGVLTTEKKIGLIDIVKQNAQIEEMQKEKSSVTKLETKNTVLVAKETHNNIIFERVSFLSDIHECWCEW